MEVLTNVIGAVESGGQVYGKRNYKAYTPPYTNTPNEHTITLGWAQNYGPEAKKLIQMIYDISPANFRNLDPKQSIYNMLSKDWVAIKWNPVASQKNILISLIDSGAGHTAQDMLFGDLMRTYIADCEKDYTSDIKAQMMYCEIRHLGGKTPVNRIFNRCNGDYTLTSIMNALNKDDPNSNQVGSKKFRSRHEKCYEFINKYAINEGTKVKTIVDEFSKYIGVTEYNGIVATIQRWYYGTLVRDAWCATSTSYFANEAGILNQLGGKNESVKKMMDACRALHKTDGRFWDYPNIPKQLKKHDVVFFQRNGVSHVAHCWQDCTFTGTGTINVLGGNQSDSICKKSYKQECVSAIYRPNYDTENRYMFELPTIRQGDSGNYVLLLQRLLRGMDYVMQNGKLLGRSGKFGDQTLFCVKNFQKNKKLTIDGIVGPKTWAALIDS